MEFVHCNVCFARYPEACSLLLANCGHIFCENCCRATSDIQLECPKCQKLCSTMSLTGPNHCHGTPQCVVLAAHSFLWLSGKGFDNNNALVQLGSEVEAFFKDPVEMSFELKRHIEHLHKVLEFQTAHRTSLLHHLEEQSQKKPMDVRTIESKVSILEEELSYWRRLFETKDVVKSNHGTHHLKRELLKTPNGHHASVPGLLGNPRSTLAGTPHGTPRKIYSSYSALQLTPGHSTLQNPNTLHGSRSLKKSCPPLGQSPRRVVRSVMEDNNSPCVSSSGMADVSSAARRKASTSQLLSMEKLLTQKDLDLSQAKMDNKQLRDQLVTLKQKLEEISQSTEESKICYQLTGDENNDLKKKNNSLCEQLQVKSRSTIMTNISKQVECYQKIVEQELYIHDLRCQLHARYVEVITLKKQLEDLTKNPGQQKKQREVATMTETSQEACKQCKSGLDTILPANKLEFDDNSDSSNDLMELEDENVNSSLFNAQLPKTPLILRPSPGVHKLKAMLRKTPARGSWNKIGASKFDIARPKQHNYQCTDEVPIVNVRSPVTHTGYTEEDDRIFNFSPEL